ncbi:NAD(P)-binding domain-containing protein [Paenibacillus sp. ATY16]|uniref:NAD(P)-binding domain-containing protein n=1 Tax=Paenibacillus sp. ATY16 TaxID=1759312 RepID=UPI0032C49915
MHIKGAAGVTKIQNDFVFSLIGYQPDLDLLEKIGVQIDPETKSPSFDPETYETNIPRIFIAGVVAGGITNKVFIDDGRLHGLRIAARI